MRPDTVHGGRRKSDDIRLPLQRLPETHGQCLFNGCGGRDTARSHLFGNQQHLLRIRDLRFFCIGLIVIVIWQTYSLSGISDRITVHIPPQLDRGAILNPGEVPKPNLYSFSHYLFQKLNTWEENPFVFCQ